MSKFSLDLASDFGEARGMNHEISRIMSASWPPYTSSVRRGLVLDLFASRNVLDEFKQLHWPLGNSVAGRRQADRDLHKKRLYESGAPAPHVIAGRARPDVPRRPEGRGGPAEPRP